VAETPFSEPDLVDAVLALLPLYRDCPCRICLLESLCHTLLPLPQHCSLAFVALALAALVTKLHHHIVPFLFELLVLVEYALPSVLPLLLPIVMPCCSCPQLPFLLSYA
jgi:hypothetical protein